MSDIEERDPVVTIAFDRQPWMINAACRGTDPDLFFPAVGESAAEARAVCAGCPVRQQCLQTAIDNDEKYGIFGGLNRHERRYLRMLQREPSIEQILTAAHHRMDCRGYAPAVRRDRAWLTNELAQLRADGAA